MRESEDRQTSSPSSAPGHDADLREQTAPLPAEAHPDRDTLVRAATYALGLHASLDQVFENVLDWEHLPGLHRTSFDSIECLASGAWGWLADVVSSRGGRASRVALRIDRPRTRYLARTIAGVGTGTEIWTELRPVGALFTDVWVEFWLPRHPNATRRGAALVRQYERLWAEDATMISQRAALRAALRTRDRAPADLALGPLEALRAALPMRVEFGGLPYQVIELGGELRAHAAFCPHRLGPLVGKPDARGSLWCPWHRYRFDVDTGRCTRGGRYRLAAAPSVDVSDATNVRLTLR